MKITPKFYDVQQNEEDWYDLRKGKITASMSSDLFAKPETKTYKNVITKVAFEIVTGKSQKQFVNGWMDYGHETEPEARENYCAETFSQVSNGGIWVANDWIAASPDGKIVNENGGVEFKCPAISTYRDYLESAEKNGKTVIPKNYFIQMQFQLICTGWDYIDYMPYYSRELKQLLTRVYICEETRTQIFEKLDIAILEIKELIEKIKR